MGKWKRLTVHTDSQHRIASIDCNINRESAGPSIKAATK